MNSLQKVLVTGGAGFIGSTLVRTLHDKGVSVVVLDSLITGKRENVPAGVELIEADIRDAAAVQSAMEGVSHVVHLAALVSVPESIAQPLLTHDVNVVGMLNVLEAARMNGVQRVVYASSAAVYGDEPTLPKREDTPLAPQSPYALSKLQDEQLAAYYARIHGLTTVGTRFFNVYGPGQAGNHPYASVVPRWIEALQAGKELTVYGDGSQTRDFVHVRDVARALHCALTAPLTGTHVYNVASGTETSLKELRDLLADALGREIAWEEHPERPGDIKRSVAAVEAAKDELAFSVEIPLQEGINELVA